MSTIANRQAPAPAALGGARAELRMRAPVLEIQRARLLAAAGRQVGEAGAVTVSSIVQRAGVSRRTFYELFPDCESCLLAALEAALDRARERVMPAWCAQGSWRERLRSTLVELLRMFDGEPALARLLVVESLGLGRPALELRSRAIAALVSAVDEGRIETRASADPPPLSAEGAVGGALGVIYTRLTQPDADPLTELVNPLMSVLVLPYRGAAAARAELRRPLPPPVERNEPEENGELRDDPFKAAGMRMTYRTMRVLSAIGDHAGCSNRQVGVYADVTDQGQVSKLLARLARAGLIDNGGREHARGEANAWRLTDMGRQITERIDAHSDKQLTSKGGRS
jgi:AcrR family transcriptional regulator/DNA-binding MarR family transcriptional regulator